MKLRRTTIIKAALFFSLIALSAGVFSAPVNDRCMFGPWRPECLVLKEEVQLAPFECKLDPTLSSCHLLL